MSGTMFDGFYANRRVLVTGHTGFKGAWLTLWLRRMGAVVTGYSLDPPSEPSLFKLAGVDADADWVRADLRDADALAETVERVRPEVVVHMAAQALVGEGYAHPAETFEVNVQGTVNLLEALRTAGGEPAVIAVTSDKCYEPRATRGPQSPEDAGHAESDRLGGRDPYSASKACAELVARAYRDSFFLDSGPRVATVRAGNVIGGGDFGADRLIPDAVAALGRGEPLTLRRPGATRPWQYVLDPLAGYLLLARLLVEDGRKWARAWNFGPEPGEVATVSVLLDAFMDAYGCDLERIEGGEPYEENPALVLDSSAFRTALGWRPMMDFQAMVGATAYWYREVLDRGGDARRASLDRIGEYERLVEEKT